MGNLIPPPDDLPVIVGQTALERRQRAMEFAEALVDRLAAPKMKPNGYPVDGYRTPTLEERTAQILRVAEFIAEGPDR